MTGPNVRTAEERAQRRFDEFAGLMWHLAAFIIVNAFLWGLDIIQGGGVQWAFWTTIPWGVGLAFHVAAYMLEGSRFKERKYQAFLAEERAKDEHNRSLD